MENPSQPPFAPSTALRAGAGRNFPLFEKEGQGEIL